MQTISLGAPSLPVLTSPDPNLVLGNSILINLELFPELAWIQRYLQTLHSLQQERDRLAQAITAIEALGEVRFNQWIEPYCKTKNGKTYTYAQLRWLTGETKPSGQPRVKTRHLSRAVVGEVRAAIERGQQIHALQQQQAAIEQRMTALKHRVHRIHNVLSF